jgi:ferredoxin
MSVRVIVDLDVCQAHGECVRLAPDLFALDADLVLSWQHEVPSQRLADVEQAATQCPTGAIRVEGP